MNQHATPPQNAPEFDLDSYHDLSVGQILQRTREHYGQTIPQVEVNLRIRGDHIYAIEQGDVANLPGRVYAIGFVRAYAEYLGLDGDKIVHLFKSQTIGKENKANLQFPVTYQDTKTPSAFIIFGCLVGLVLLVTYISMTYKPPNHVEIIPPVPEDLKQGSVPLLKQEDVVEIEESVEEPVVEILKPSPKNTMELVVSEDSWAEIKNASGKVLLRQVLKPGDKYIVPEDEKGLILSTGNAGGITVFVKGKKYGTLGRPTEVRRNIQLDAKNFR